MKRETFPDLSAADRGVLRFMTCGSVDDGKSTLIGRLLYDTKALLADTVATLQRHAERRGLSAPDLSLLTDGLIAEREQGITIDVAYRYFATADRKFIIADAPGHEQYTRNMVTAASTADVAVLLVDARKGIVAQTRRHATIAALLGVQQLIVAVNKMDLVGFERRVFEAIEADFRAWRAAHRELDVELRFIPICALDGAMIVERGGRLPWYTGETLVELLEAAPSTQLDTAAPLRLPVQWVCRPSRSDSGAVEATAEGRHGFRGYAGRIEVGSLAVGDEIVVQPAGQRSRVTRLSIGEVPVASAFAGQSVLVSLADEIDISRGDLLVRAGEPPVAPRREFEATVCWLSAQPLSPARTYLLQHTTRATRARVARVDARLDVEAAAWRSADGAVGLNDLARIQVRTQQPLVVDSYAANRATGAFILIDEATHDTVAAGLVR
jgi:sulfate adenylyltransferase subunit 1